MEVIFVLVPVSLVIVVAALWAFVWSVRNDQFEDLDKEAYGILFDDEASDNSENRTRSDLQNVSKSNQESAAGNAGGQK